MRPVVQDNVALVDHPQLIGILQILQKERLVARDAGDERLFKFVARRDIPVDPLASFCAPKHLTTPFADQSQCFIHIVWIRSAAAFTDRLRYFRS